MIGSAFKLDRINLRPLSERGLARNVVNVVGEFGAGSDQHVLHGPAPGDDQADGAANFKGELGQRFGRFSGDDVIRGHAPPIEPLKHGELAGAETECLSVNFRNGRRVLRVSGYVACAKGAAMEAWASMVSEARIPVRRACLPASAIIAALSVQ